MRAGLCLSYIGGLDMRMAAPAEMLLPHWISCLPGRRRALKRFLRQDIRLFRRLIKSAILLVEFFYIPMYWFCTLSRLISFGGATPSTFIMLRQLGFIFLRLFVPLLQRITPSFSVLSSFTL